MNTPANTQPRQPIPIGVATAIGAMVIAGGAWTLIGLYIARTLALGLILLPLASGCGAGFVMRLGGTGLSRRARLVAVAVTLLGCVVGDFFWLALVPNQSPIPVLLGAELVQTMNVVLNLQKAVLYAVACYLAYSIVGPPKGDVYE